MASPIKAFVLTSIRLSGDRSSVSAFPSGSFPPFPFCHFTFRTRLPTPPSRALEISFDGRGGEKKRKQVCLPPKSINQSKEITLFFSLFETTYRRYSRLPYPPQYLVPSVSSWVWFGFGDDAYRVGMMRARARHSGTMRHCRFSAPQPLPSHFTLCIPMDINGFLATPSPPLPLFRGRCRGGTKGRQDICPAFLL